MTRAQVQLVRDVLRDYGAALYRPPGCSGESPHGCLFIEHLLYAHMWDVNYPGYNYVDVGDVLPSWYYPEHTYNDYNLDTWETQRMLNFIYREGRGFFAYSVQSDWGGSGNYDRSERIIREYGEIQLITSTPWHFWAS